MVSEEGLFWYNNLKALHFVTIHLFCLECEGEIEVSQLLFAAPMGTEEYKAYVKPHKCE